MPFEKGHTYSLGRPKGRSNKSTEIVKKSIAKLLENNIDIIQHDLDRMEPKDRVNALLQFLKFHIPTQKAVEVQDYSGYSNNSWIEKVMAADPHELNKKILDGNR